MNVDFNKYADGLAPAIVQDTNTQKVLMLGYMNAESFRLTRSTGKATFYSRSRQRLWVKGETSGNFLLVEKVLLDCDNDTILIKAKPTGPICHTGADTCFGKANEPVDFLFELEKTIKERKANPAANSYTSNLFAKGLNKIAQKVGEEAVELVIEAKDSDDERFKAEAADLLYHLLVLFADRKIDFAEILDTLKSRSL